MVVTWVAHDGRAEWNGRPLAEWVAPLVGQIVDILDPDAVWLFGSVARGDDDGDSDIEVGDQRGDVGRRHRDLAVHEGFALPGL